MGSGIQMVSMGSQVKIIVETNIFICRRVGVFCS